MIQIVHNILGNAYQDEQEVTIANQDFGNNACIIVGYHDKLKTQPGKNRVVMKDLHPNNDKQQQKYIVICFQIIPTSSPSY
jgi:hypothetical protein